jgi:hypothetical protein
VPVAESGGGEIAAIGETTCQLLRGPEDSGRFTEGDELVALVHAPYMTRVHLEITMGELKVRGAKLNPHRARITRRLPRRQAQCLALPPSFVYVYGPI